MTGEGVGVLLRLRGHRTGVDFTVNQDNYLSSGRSDTRAAADLILDLGGGALVPYLLAGAGLNVVHQEGISDTAQQGYLEAGGGLALRLGSRFEVAGDVRLGERRLSNQDGGDVAPVPCCQAQQTYGVFPSDKETSAEARLSAIVYF